MICKKCGFKRIVKNGFVKGEQRFKCKKCSYCFQDKPNRGVDMKTKLLALMMYTEGMGFRSIERIIGVSNVAIIKRVKKLGAQLQIYHEERKGKNVVEVMELDEMWNFIKKNKINHGFGLFMIEKGKGLLIL